MAEIFSGDWTIECLSPGLWTKRFIIEHSLASDGVYLLGVDPHRNWGPLETARILTTSPISVSGPSWSIRFEWDGGTSVGWQPDTTLKRSSVTYTLQGGFVVDLLSDNTSVIAAHGLINVFDSASLRCHNVDPKLNPWHPFVNPYDFTLPKRRKPSRPGLPPKQPD